MDHIAPARIPARPDSRRLLAILALVAVTILASLAHLSLPSSAHSLVDVLRGDDHGPVGVADGVVPEGTTVFDGDVPAVGRLDPLLLAALRRAGAHAAQDGVELRLNSGWRSPAYQERLLTEAASTYGSEAQAALWVATPETSAHVSGDAIDVADGAAAWLSAHGAGHGLCQIYANEPWHYELRPDAVRDGCPRQYADPAHDPRTRS